MSPIAASTTWIVVASSLALYLLVAAPVVAGCLYAIRRKGPDALPRAVRDVERFIELRERARSELARTGSLERFAERKDEARKHLWPLDGRGDQADEDGVEQAVPEPRPLRRGGTAEAAVGSRRRLEPRPGTPARAR